MSRRNRHQARRTRSQRPARRYGSGSARIQLMQGMVAPDGTQREQTRGYR